MSKTPGKITVDADEWLELKLRAELADEVKTDNSVPEKSVIPPVVPLRGRAHSALRSMRGNKPITAYLSFFSRTTGIANTPFGFGIPVQPNLDSSWTSWQSVFDEMRVVRAEVHWKIVCLISATATPTAAPNAVLAYDPSGIALTSVNAGLEYEKFKLLAIPTSKVDNFYSVPMATTPSGFLKMTAVIPKGPQVSETDPLLSAGLWRPTQDSDNYIWGSFVGYVSQGGTSCVLSSEAFIRMTVEFRVRR